MRGKEVSHVLNVQANTWLKLLYNPRTRNYPCNFRKSSQYRLVCLGIRARKVNRRVQWLHQFRDVLYSWATLTYIADRNLPFKEEELKLTEQVIDVLTLRMQKSTSTYPRTLKDLYQFTFNSLGSNDCRNISSHWMSVLAQSTVSPLDHQAPWWSITAGKQMGAKICSCALTEMLQTEKMSFFSSCVETTANLYHTWHYTVLYKKPISTEQPGGHSTWLFSCESFSHGV